jgi:hypothetical protein
VPGHPWIPGLTVALYVLVLATIIGTQPRLAIGGGLMIGTLVIAGIATAEFRRTVA